MGEAKRNRNLEQHGIDFRVATRILDGRPMVEVPARQEGKPRILTIAMIGDVFVTVGWTWRGHVRRIIPARRSP